MSNKIEKIKSILKAGAKATKYRVYITFPSEISTQAELEEISVLAKAASFPAMTIGQIEVFNQGRKIPIPGDTSYETLWEVTFYNDDAHKVRRDLLTWMKAIDNFQANTYSGDPAKLFVNLKVAQLDALENESAIYTFHNCWPQNVGEISVGADQLDTLQEFPVSFSFSDWVVGEDEFNNPQIPVNPARNVVAPDQ